jgi:hypothetical protein
VCTENLNLGIVVKRSAEDGERFDASDPLNPGERPAHLCPMTGAALFRRTTRLDNAHSTGFRELLYPTRSIAKEVGVQPRIVSLWRHRCADHGLEGLKDKPRRGKQLIYTKATDNPPVDLSEAEAKPSRGSNRAAIEEAVRQAAIDL